MLIKENRAIVPETCEGDRQGMTEDAAEGHAGAYKRMTVEALGGMPSGRPRVSTYGIVVGRRIKTWKRLGGRGPALPRFLFAYTLARFCAFAGRCVMNVDGM